MDYYKSTLGGIYKVFAADSTTGHVTIILNYNNSGMYNVLNQQLSTTSTSGSSQYEMYVQVMEPATREEFLTYLNLTKSFLNNL